MMLIGISFNLLAQTCQICAGLAADIHPTNGSSLGDQAENYIEIDGYY